MTAEDLLGWVEAYDRLAYGLLFVYAIAKTGPLPMVAGYVSVLGALDAFLVALTVLSGSAAGGQLRFAAGRWGAPYFFSYFPKVAPWVALGAAGIERFGSWLLPLYRFSKGVFTAVGTGAGASLIRWHRFSILDGSGAALWAVVSVSVGAAIGLAGIAVDPRWGAFFGLGLLVAGIAATVVLGKRLRVLLQPLAERALSERARSA